VRARIFIGFIGVIAALWLAPGAGAVTVTIGSLKPVVDATTCGGCTELQLASDPESPSYVVPPLPSSGNPWTLVTYSVRGSTSDGTARAEIWRPSGTPGEFRLIAASPDGQIPANSAPSIPASIPVQPGDVLGIRSGASIDPNYDSPHAGDVVMSGMGTDPSVGETMGLIGSDNPSFNNGSTLLNITARLVSADPVATPTPAGPVKKKCKKKKHKKRAAESKKKKCKKRKKK
jgi:hypothetical protein